MLVEDTGVICIQTGACVWYDCGRSFTYNRKRSVPRIEPCGTTYFNVPASEKTVQTKNFLFER